MCGRVVRERTRSRSGRVEKKVTLNLESAGRGRTGSHLKSCTGPTSLNMSRRRSSVASYGTFPKNTLYGGPPPPISVARVPRDPRAPSTLKTRGKETSPKSTTACVADVQKKRKCAESSRAFQTVPARARFEKEGRARRRARVSVSRRSTRARELRKGHRGPWVPVRTRMARLERFANSREPTGAAAAGLANATSAIAPAIARTAVDTATAATIVGAGIAETDTATASGTAAWTGGDARGTRGKIANARETETRAATAVATAVAATTAIATTRRVTDRALRRRLNRLWSRIKRRRRR